MTLRSKILLIISITLVGMYIVLSLASRTILSSSFYELEDKYVRFFVLYLLIGGLFIGAITLLLLESTVISRLGRLNAGINNIGVSNNLALRIAMPGRDEVSRLAASINSMLSDLQQFQGELRASRERYRNLADELSTAYQQLMDIIEFLPDATFVIDREKKVIAWNRAIEEMSGVRKEEIIGQGNYAYAVPFYGTNRPILIDLINADNKEIERKYEFINKKGQTLYAEVSVPSLHQGKGGFLWATASPLFDGNGCVVGAIESLRDITERKRAEDQLKYLSLHDSLTGLYNRTYFEQDMHRLEGGRYAPTGVILCDIDGLKLVNDTLGHEAGDRLLLAASIILKESFRTGDMVARIGGDEFAVLLPDSNETVVETACHRIREALARYNEVNKQLPLSMSIGYAIGNGPSINMVDLFKEADNNVYREKLHRSQSARSAIVQTLMKAIEARDFITEGHADRLQRLVADVAQSIGLPGHRVADLRLLAQFHDIGKVGIPDRILFKPERLTPEEFTEMQRHCEIGYRIAQSSPDLTPIADWILKHHEWWNGLGYPLGLKGEEIPLECRLLAIADAYDAMTSDRSYRKAVSRNEAIAELIRCAGTQFDPQLALKFVQVIENSCHRNDIQATKRL